MRKGFRPGKHPDEIKSKEQAKEEAAKQKDFEERLEKLKPEVVELCRKYKIDIVGAMQYRPNGAFPIVAYLDVKDKYEHKTQEAKDSEEKPKGLIV